MYLTWCSTANQSPSSRSAIRDWVALHAGGAVCRACRLGSLGDRHKRTDAHRNPSSAIGRALRGSLAGGNLFSRRSLCWVMRIRLMQYRGMAIGQTSRRSRRHHGRACPTAVHVVRFIEPMRARRTGGKLCVYRPLQSATPIPAASLEWRRVDGRDKPGHDGGVRGAAENGRLTGSAIRANLSVPLCLLVKPKKTAAPCLVRIESRHCWLPSGRVGTPSRSHRAQDRAAAYRSGFLSRSDARRARRGPR